MPIEWWPRGPYGGQSWLESDVPERGQADEPYLDVAREGGPAVVVPTRPRRLPELRLARTPLGASIRGGALFHALVALVVGLAVTAGSVARGAAWLPVAAVGASVSVYGLVQTPRVLGLLLRRRRGVSLSFTTAGLAVDGLAVPWTAVDDVVTFRSALEPNPLFDDQLPWSWLAVRVRDFDAVVGLSPVRAGLANLTRRRLVLLVEASEVARPWDLRDALECLVEDPSLRPLLATQDGVRLLLEGEP